MLDGIQHTGFLFFHIQFFPLCNFSFEFLFNVCLLYTSENLINKYLKCRKLNKELADAFVDKVQVFEDGRISVNLVYDDCLEELLQVKNKREGDLYE